MLNGRKNLPISQRYIVDRIESHEMSVMSKPEIFPFDTLVFWRIGKETPCENRERC